MTGPRPRRPRRPTRNGEQRTPGVGPDGGGDGAGELAGGVAEEGERGLQAERTELSWVRTALACGVLTTVTGRISGDQVPHVASYALGAAVAATGVAASVIRIGALRRRPPGPGMAPAPPPRLAVALLVAAVVVANLTVGVTILAP